MVEKESEWILPENLRKQELKSRKPFFSVVIPTYNCAILLERALSSVLAQTYQNFEIVVVDNSSADDTLDVLEAIDDPRLSIIEVNNDGIIAYSRNTGIKIARGPWIAFLDADDVWYPDKLEVVRAAILENPESILICHDEWRVVEGGRKNYLHYTPSTSNIYESLLFKKNCLSPSAVTLQKGIAIKTNGFSENKKFVTAEDYEFWLRLSQEGPFHFINKALGEWHIHTSNTSKNAEIKVNSSMCVRQYHLGLWQKEYPELIAKARRCKARIWADSARTLLGGRNFSKASKYALRAIFQNPLSWKAWVILLLSIMHLPI